MRFFFLIIKTVRIVGNDIAANRMEYFNRPMSAKALNAQSFLDLSALLDNYFKADELSNHQNSRNKNKLSK